MKTKKSIISIFILNYLILFNVSAQITNYDVRKTNWGMTKQEVISSETPLKPNIKNDEIAFYDVILNDILSANIFYEFENEKLNSVRYVVTFRYKSAPCADTISIPTKVDYIIPFYRALIDKGFACAENDINGWSHTDVKNKYIFNRNNFTSTFIKDCRDASYECSASYYLTNKNNRTIVFFDFRTLSQKAFKSECESNQRMISEMKKKGQEEYLIDKFKCSDLICRIRFSKTYDLEKKDEQGNF